MKYRCALLMVMIGGSSNNSSGGSSGIAAGEMAFRPREMIMKTNLGNLTVQQTYNAARAAGFPPDVARQMVAIAQRESGLKANAACVDCFKKPDGTPIREASIGLWQINWNDQGIKNLLQKQLGVTSPDQLKDPLTNARAAYLLYGNDPNNLNIAWSINREGQFGYASKYQQFLSQLPPTSALEQQQPQTATQDMVSGNDALAFLDYGMSGGSIVAADIVNDDVLIGLAIVGLALLLAA